MNIQSNAVHLSALVEEKHARPTDRETISLETLSLGSYDVATVAEEYPAAFLAALSKLGPVDQQLLLAYHVLRTTQTALGKAYGYLQSNMAQQLWIASRRLAYHLLFPSHPTADELRPILERHELERTKLAVPTSELLAYYLANHDWSELYELTASAPNGARNTHILQSWVQSTLRRIRERGMVSSDTRLQALGAYLDSIPGFMGNYRDAQRQQREETDVHIVHPACLGEFRVNVSDPGFKSYLTSRANGPKSEDEDSD